MKKSGLLCLFAFLIVLLGLLMPRQVVAAKYIVQPGDTLTYIAQQFGTTVDAIVQANDISDPNLIVVGQVLDIPTEDSAESSASIVFEPTESLLVADFDTCSDFINELGGEIGPAFQAPDNRLDRSIIQEVGRGCVAKLEYEVKDWGAFWLKLQDTNLAPFRESNGFLTFDIRAEAPIPNGVKIELKRFCSSEGTCGELSVYYMTGITSEWQTRSVPLDGFGTTGWAATLSSWDSVEELIFTFEAANSGNNGFVYLDNITFVR